MNIKFLFISDLEKKIQTICWSSACSSLLILKEIKLCLKGHISSGRGGGTLSMCVICGLCSFKFVCTHQGKWCMSGIPVFSIYLAIRDKTLYFVLWCLYTKHSELTTSENELTWLYKGKSSLINFYTGSWSSLNNSNRLQKYKSSHFNTEIML